jgi:hypothetical protein
LKKKKQYSCGWIGLYFGFGEPMERLQLNKFAKITVVYKLPSPKEKGCVASCIYELFLTYQKKFMSCLLISFDLR